MGTIAEARKKIEKAIDQNGQYSHNICGLVLSSVSRDHGLEAANNLIDEFALDEIYGIHKVPVKAKYSVGYENGQPVVLMRDTEGRTSTVDTAPTRESAEKKAARWQAKEDAAYKKAQKAKK